MADRQLPQQPARQHAENEDERQQPEGEQAAHFADIGLREVAQHVRVDEHPVLAHEIGDAGTGEEEKYQHGFQHPAEGEQDEHAVEDGQHHHGEGGAHGQAAGARRNDGEHVVPQREVVEQEQQEAGQEGQGFRAD
ncbi:hypothetical protein D3C76_1017630 [compost metagenome]